VHYLRFFDQVLSNQMNLKKSHTALTMYLDKLLIKISFLNFLVLPRINLLSASDRLVPEVY
jgi:hypothetical protein